MICVLVSSIKVLFLFIMVVLQALKPEKFVMRKGSTNHDTSAHSIICNSNEVVFLALAVGHDFTLLARDGIVH